jgi:hypothetical protein
LPFFKTCRSSLEAIHYSALLVASIADAYAGSGYYRKTSDGCDGKAVGFGGSLRPKSLGDILKLMKIVGERVVGLGAGDGRVLAAARVLGAQSAVGCELPGKIAQKFVFDAVIFRMISSSAAKSCHCKWNGIDIEEVDNLFAFIFVTAKLTRMAFESFYNWNHAISDFFLHRSGLLRCPTS